MLRRLTERNLRADANALAVTAEALDDFFARFEPPGDDEMALIYPGDTESLSVLLEQARRTGRQQP
ncbi:hypothetical protein ACFVTP_13180 [Streptomyces celluloflavus]|uniref:hypothetical protein n=1 Tax=Streptomyces celluloflavus TaxID=58344 RepID=UPI0036DDBF69